MAKNDGIYPAPVYVAEFSDGSKIRMSYYSKRGKPLDHGMGRRLCSQVIANERARVPVEPGSDAYFASDEYRRLLRMHAQALVDECVTEICGSPMPITVKRYKTYKKNGEVLRDRHGNYVWNTARCGYDSVPLFRQRLPNAPPPATDIISGHTERKDTGEIVPDPYFGPPDNVVPLRATKTPLERAIALLAKLSASERAILAERIAA